MIHYGHLAALVSSGQPVADRQATPSASLAPPSTHPAQNTLTRMPAISLNHDVNVVVVHSLEIPAKRIMSTLLKERDGDKVGAQIILTITPDNTEMNGLEPLAFRLAHAIRTLPTDRKLLVVCPYQLAGTRHEDRFTAACLLRSLRAMMVDPTAEAVRATLSQPSFSDLSFLPDTVQFRILLGADCDKRLAHNRTFLAAAGAPAGSYDRHSLQLDFVNSAITQMLPTKKSLLKSVLDWFKKPTS